MSGAATIAGLAALGCKCGMYGDAAPRVARNLRTMATCGALGQVPATRPPTVQELGYDPEDLATMSLIGKGLDILGAKLTGAKYYSGPDPSAQAALQAQRPVFPWGPVIIIGALAVGAAMFFRRPARRR